jgi:hypothetical protein
MLSSVKRLNPKLAYWLSSRDEKLRLIVSGLIICGVLVLAFVLGRRSSIVILAIQFALLGALVLLRWPLLGFLIIIPSALVVRLEVSTGTEVSLNPASLLVPVLLGIWLTNSLMQHNLRIAPSRVNRPLLLFLTISLISIPISNVIWDPSVPRSGRFIVVQLAQWALFAFSAGIFWLVGNRITHQVWLKRIMVVYLIVAAAVALVRVTPGNEYIAFNSLSFAVERAPFWLLLTAVAAGQLLFNQRLSGRWQIFLVIVLATAIYYALDIQRERSSNWVGVFTALGVLAFLRFPKLRWLTFVALIATMASGVLFSFIYDFAGGDEKWTESGASRGVLIQRVIELSMRNPITGIGPAAYRPYGLTRPLFYEGAYWIEPRINSHNNYVDLFSQVGVVGLGIFLWFMAELAWLGWRLRKVFKDGFESGYVNGMLAAWVGIMVIMALADWFLPSVYNIGFPGFQASVLLWMFFGGLIALEQIARAQTSQPMSD